MRHPNAFMVYANSKFKWLGFFISSLSPGEGYGEGPVKNATSLCLGNFGSWIILAVGVWLLRGAFL